MLVLQFLLLQVGIYLHCCKNINIETNVKIYPNVWMINEVELCILCGNSGDWSSPRVGKIEGKILSNI